MTNKEGPFYAAFGGDTTGIIKQELITYKETVKRDYHSQGDYIDSCESIPLKENKHEHTA
jgi:hypothetical protein